MILWRISADTRRYQADDLSGRGAETTGGRWNEVGLPVVYTATTRALACLETVVHLNAGGLPLNRYLVEIDAPDALMAAAIRLEAAALPAGWDDQPETQASVAIGSAWLRAGAAALLVAPSVIVPEEFNVLINPAHPDSAQVTARKVRPWTYDPRLLRV